ncbi:hypothetical protein F5878DRAFT_644304 [Lentinula raphanica]|uniref:Uncharacterized protein n=1 Tax=Lentinula raphanica TaxID=153919 RepID=A0AA38UAA2_9AGAR|nr:hypothetical protein F5878DRAFT_644304 [Lentinula raphanica]
MRHIEGWTRNVLELACSILIAKKSLWVYTIELSTSGIQRKVCCFCNLLDREENLRKSTTSAKACQFGGMMFLFSTSIWRADSKVGKFEGFNLSWPSRLRLPDSSWRFFAPLRNAGLQTERTASHHSMAQRLQSDPATIPRPDHSSEDYAFLRTALIGDANSPEVTNHEEAAQKLTEQWERRIATLKVQYQAQQQADQEELERRMAEEEEAERLRQQEERERELEAAKEAEKKRTTLHGFKRGVGAPGLPSLLHPYAEKAMMARKYVPLWYFLPDAMLEAGERLREVPDNNQYQISNNLSGPPGSTLVLVGTDSTRPSPAALPDARLTWAQVTEAKTSFMRALDLGDWPDKYITMFAQFFANMEVHRELSRQDGKRVMALYQAEMRADWHRANDRREGYDLSVINLELLNECREDIRSADHKMWMRESGH